MMGACIVGAAASVKGSCKRPENRDIQAMDTDETAKPKPVKPVLGGDLGDQSIDALNAYIADLEAEIARVRADIEAKQTAKAQADAVFKK